MAITQANLNQLASLNAEFWYRNNGGQFKKAVLNSNDINDNSPTNWQIRLINGAKFTSEKVIIVYDFAGNPRNKELTKDATNDKAGSNMTTTGVNVIRDFNFTTEITTPFLTVTQYIINTLTANNCAMFKNNVQVVLNDVYYKDDIIKITSPDKTKINPDGTYFRDENGGVNYLTVVGNSATLKVEYVLTTLTLDILNPLILLSIDDAVNFSRANIILKINGVNLPSSWANNLTVPIFYKDVLTINPKTNFSLVEGENYFIYNGGRDNFIINNGVGELIAGSNDYTGYNFKAIDTTVRFTLTQSIIDVLEENHCLMYKNDSLLKLGDTAINGDILSIIPSVRYEINGKPTLDIYYNDSGYGGDVTFDVIDENRKAVLTIDVYSNGDGYLTNLDLAVTQVDITSGSNAIYKVNKAQLKQINVDRYSVVTTSQGTQILDYGVNILGLIAIPLTLPSDFIQDDENVVLGTKQTNVTAPKLISDQLYYDLGSINIPSPKNTLDYTNTNAVLKLPYAPDVNLELSDILGYTISIQYIIDLYSGATVVNIFSSKNDTIIVSTNVNLGVNIPYISNKGYDPLTFNTNISLGGDNSIRKPELHIIQNTPILPYGFFTSPITSEKVLNGEKGYIEVENINLKCNATKSEQNSIISLLKSGVIIND